ncbi:MAG TPA: TIGR03668 family PPOX class F420-dependent oxidoreductase [Actinomycetota bacterium]|nr:TIGR03668 family PPOX class F420-dependent oxidoreductase [Actinomycetota bacterium]
MRLPADESRRRAGTARVARIATVGPDGSPHLVPICFALQAGTLYSSTDAKPKTTSNLRRLRNIERDPRVTVLVDHYEDDWTRLWWVRMDGEARVLHAGAERDVAIELLVARYPQYCEHPPQGVVVAVDVSRWTGWSYA